MVAAAKNPFPFRLGTCVGTPGAHDAFVEAGDSPFPLLMAHSHGQWGDVPAEDAKQNEFAVRNGERIMSSYALSSGVRVWIITEADRSVTTILLPSEY